MGKVFACAMVVLLSACAESQPATYTTRPILTGPCATAIDMLPEPPGTLEVVLGVVALPTRKVLQANDRGAEGGFFAKHGLVVKADAEVELAVATGESGEGHAAGEGGAAGGAGAVGGGGAGGGGGTVGAGGGGGVTLEWNGLENAGTVTRHSPCPGQTAWYAYAGGYYVAEPQCVPIVVRAGGREQTVRIPVGVAC